MGTRPKHTRKRLRDTKAWKAVAGMAAVTIVTMGMVAAAPATATQGPPSGPPVCEGVPEVLGHEWQKQKRTREWVPEVTEVKHKEWRFQTRTQLYGSKEIKSVNGYDFVSGGSVVVQGQTVAGHWVQSPGLHQIPDVIINIVWGPSGVPEQYLGTGTVNLSSYGGPNVNVQYVAEKIQTNEGFTDWGPWSNWSTTNPGENTTTRNVESKWVVDTAGVAAHWGPWSGWQNVGDVVRTDTKVEPPLPDNTDSKEYRWSYVGTYVKTEGVPPAWQQDDPKSPCYNGPKFLESGHEQACGVLTIWLRNVSPWIYPMSVEVWNPDTEAWVHSYGPVVDNRTNGALNGPIKDQTGTRTLTFPEDSGTHLVRYRVQAGSENNLYIGKPVGEWTTLTIETDCERNEIQPILPEVTPQVCTVGDQGVPEITNGSITPPEQDEFTATVWDKDGVQVTDLDNVPPGDYKYQVDLDGELWLTIGETEGWVVSEDGLTATTTVTVEAAEDCTVDKPETPEPTYTEWVKSKFTCEDTTLTETRERTDYTQVWEDGKWVQKVTVTTETRTRDLTPEDYEEAGLDCTELPPPPEDPPTDEPDDPKDKPKTVKAAGIKWTEPSAVCVPATSKWQVTPGKIIIPSSKGVIYLENGKEIEAGRYNADLNGETVTITAKAAKKGVTLKGDSSWTKTFKKVKEKDGTDCGLAVTGGNIGTLLTYAGLIILAGIALFTVGLVGKRRESSRLRA